MDTIEEEAATRKAVSASWHGAATPLLSGLMLLVTVINIALTLIHLYTH